MNQEISHPGIVESIEADHIVVRIVQAAACSSCKAARACNASDAKEKLVDVYDAGQASELKVGQEVTVSTSAGAARHALLLGFGLPFFVLVGVLVLMLRLTGDEGLSALVALGALMPYYLALWALRHRVAESISFRIEA